MREEQFAPALPVIPYDDLDEAVAAANDTEYGLCASVWSNDEALAGDVASRLAAGTVFVNAHGHVGHRHVRAHGRLEGVRLRPRARDRGDAGVRPPARPGAPARPRRVAVSVVIRGGTVVDGTGAEPVRADVAD